MIGPRYEISAANTSPMEFLRSSEIELHLARLFVADPRWYRPLVRLLAALPGTGALSERLDNWHTARAVRRYRAAS
jgi:hypothetical protein